MADAESTAQIELLDQNLRKTHQLSARMTGILAQFDTRLNRLERTILPLHKSTQAGAQLQTNLDRTLAALSTVRTQQAASVSSTSRLQTPPTTLAAPPAEIESFLSALTGVVSRLADLRLSGLPGAQAELADVSKQADRAFSSLCRLVSGALREGTPASPPDLRAPTPTDPERTLATLGLLQESGVVDYLARSPLVDAPACRKEWDGTWRVWSALRGEWLRSGIALSPGPPTASSDNDDDPTGQLVAGYLHAAQSEQALMTSLFPESHPPPPALLSTLLAPSLVALKAHLLAHVQALKRDPTPWRAYGLYGNLEMLAPAWQEFFDGLGSGAGGGGELLVLEGFGQGEVGKALRGVCMRAVPEAVERAKVAPLRPGEAPSVGVAATTTETVTFLLTLPAHAHTLKGFLNALGDRKWLMGAAPVPLDTDGGEADNGRLMEHFVYDVAAALVHSLDARAKAMRPGVGGVFLVNNMSFVRDSVLLHAPAEVGELLGPAAEDLLNGAFRTAKATYLQPYVDLARPLDSLSSTTPRQTAKDALTRFWDSLDALEAVCRAHRVGGGSGGAVRDRLKDDVRKLVGGSYEGCVGRLRGSLGPKYVRMSVEELQARLDGMVR